jgi:pimeloyl-ACP methyl ester carboxylesterase/predicted glycosyltransferase
MKGEKMRAVAPVTTGHATNPADGVRIAYAIFGPRDAARTILFLPTWSIIHSRCWKMQVPYFAQQGFRVATFDGRGNGGSDRPPSGYTTDDFARDTLAIMDTIGIDRAALVGFSAGSRWAIQVAAEYPGRVTHLALIGPGANLDGTPRRDLATFLAAPPDFEGRNKNNAVYWRIDYPDFLDWFFRNIFSEPHSTKGIEDAIAWGLETTPDVLIPTIIESATPRMASFAAAIRRPTLILHGAEDRTNPLANGEAIHAAIAGSSLVVLEGCGHAPHLRDPVKVNTLIHEFIGRDVPARQTWRRAMVRPKRAVYVSSPIGLGHARRDVAIADALRARVPGLQIDWLAQHPVTAALEARGERIHPRSAQLAGESPHIESEMGGEHTLQVFRALRNMDEILLANFHVFLDAAREGNYDLWIGDEAWDVDYYLHENPELKAAPFVWLTDFVGYLPMAPAPDDREAFLTADYNAEMIEQVARFPQVRDRALFIGNPDDIVPDTFGDGLPRIRDWVEEHYTFTGYIRPFDPHALGDRDALRARFGFRPDERVAVAAVGGTSVGAGLLLRIVEAFPYMRARFPGLRLVVVCGPRIDPAAMPQHPGLEYRGYVHDLHEMLAACDVALVQGGLSTTMELVAARRPFLYFPLTGHFEQNRHVAHRLERYGVPDWARVPFAEASATTIAERLARALASPACYRPVEPDGAARAADQIAPLLEPAAVATR